MNTGFFFIFCYKFMLLDLRKIWVKNKKKYKNATRILIKTGLQSSFIFVWLLCCVQLYKNCINTDFFSLPAVIKYRRFQPSSRQKVVKIVLEDVFHT
ncbi:hypothetical protein [uncultured Neglectibacter sp.]|uniref:hypothetical protein n=1 Tax=uncultured Neglectibacter sp. TaxID=1924108 RepID=UPI0034DF4703